MFNKFIYLKSRSSSKESVGGMVGSTWELCASSQGRLNLCLANCELERDTYSTMTSWPVVQNLLAELENMMFGHCMVSVPPPFVIKGNFDR